MFHGVDREALRSPLGCAAFFEGTCIYTTFSNRRARNPIRPVFIRDWRNPENRGHKTGDTKPGTQNRGQKPGTGDKNRGQKTGDSKKPGTDHGFRVGLHCIQPNLRATGWWQTTVVVGTQAEVAKNRGLSPVFTWLGQNLTVQ